MVALLLALLATHAGAQETTPPAADAAKAQADPEAATPRHITKRANDVIAFASVDANKADRVREVLINQYRSLRTVHDRADAELKTTDDAGDKATIKADADARSRKLHDEFVAKLRADLTPQQVEQGQGQADLQRRHVTYDAYCDELPQLTERRKTYIRAQLVEAREIAMDQGPARTSTPSSASTRADQQLPRQGRLRHEGRRRRMGRPPQGARGDGATNERSK
jgi:hypothetical protein